MIVLTVDQRGSRADRDRVPELLDRLETALAGREGVVRPFQRTVGDEVQAVLDAPALAVDVVLDLVRAGGWSVGVGAGPLDEPLPDDARAGSGEAFVLARTAVERAKGRGRTAAVAVAGAAPDRAAECEAVLSVLAAIMARRTTAGWAVIDAVEAGDVTQEEVAVQLGITQQAVSQRLRTALWAEERAVRPVASRLLDEAQG